MNKNSHDNCCPPFDPEIWNDKTHIWTDKLFIKDSIPQFFHFPFPGSFGRSVMRLWKQASSANATLEMKDFLLLAHDPSAWKADLYMTVSKEVPGSDNIRLSGTFYSRVFDGPFNRIPQYIREMDIHFAKKNELALKYYFYFTTCPKCAKKYGHNYIVAFAEL